MTKIPTLRVVEHCLDPLNHTTIPMLPRSKEGLAARTYQRESTPDISSAAFVAFKSQMAHSPKDKETLLAIVLARARMGAKKTQPQTERDAKAKEKRTRKPKD